MICILPEIGTMVEYSSAIDKAKGLVWRNDEYGEQLLSRYDPLIEFLDSNFW